MSLTRVIKVGGSVKTAAYLVAVGLAYVFFKGHLDAGDSNIDSRERPP